MTGAASASGAAVERVRVGGIDLGATNLRAAVADGEGSIIGRADRSTPDAPGGQVTEAVIEALTEACAGAGVEPAELFAVGIGSIGPLDHAAGAVVGTPNHGADRIDLAGPIRRLCDADVFLHNDCAAGAIGERYYADAGPDLAYVTLSTGVGAGAIVDGHVLSGHRGNAAEMGHVVVEPGGRRCGCGGAGHWEAYAGGASLPGFARDLAAGTAVETDLALADLDAATVLGADDPLSDLVRERLAGYNALGVAATVHAFDPATVAVGGAVARNHPDLVAPVRERLPDLLVADPPTVRLTELGDDAVLKGAVASALSGGTGVR